MTSLFDKRRARWLADAHRQASEAQQHPSPVDTRAAVKRWDADRVRRGPALTARELSILAAETLTLERVWHIALTEDVELRGREVWSRDAELDGDPAAQMTFDGVLAPSITEEQFWTAVADAYGK